MLHPVLMHPTLLASSYSTPGRRAFGSRGTIPDGFIWAKMDWSGLNIAEGIVTNFEEEVRAPCFISASTVVKSVPKVGVFLVHGFIHKITSPDVVVALGDWVVDNQWLVEFYTKKLGWQKVAKLVGKFPGGSYLCDWPDAVALKVCEPGTIMEKFGAPPAVGRVENDQDVHNLAGVIHPQGGKLVVTELEGQWGMPRLLGLLPSALRTKLPPGSITAPSGLVPDDDDFEPIAYDAFTIGRRVIPIGGEPGRPIHAVKLDGGRIGAPISRPHNGTITCRLLLSLADPLVAPLVDQSSWARMPQAELVLTDTEITVPVSSIPTPITSVLIVSKPMYHPFRLSSSNVRAAQLRLDRSGAHPRLVALQTPITPAHVVRELVTYYTECAGVDVGHATENLRNEIVTQVTPETTAQKSLGDARAVVRGYDFSALQAIMQAAGCELVWLGDRALTFEYHFTILRYYLCARTGTCMSGSVRQYCHAHVILLAEKRFMQQRHKRARAFGAQGPRAPVVGCRVIISRR